MAKPTIFKAISYMKYCGSPLFEKYTGFSSIFINLTVIVRFFVTLFANFQISWLLLWFAQDPFYLYASRLIAGFIGGAGYLIGPLWLSEIVDNR